MKHDVIADEICRKYNDSTNKKFFDECLQEAYQEIRTMPVPKKRKIRNVWRTIAISGSSIAACLLLLFGLNAGNPVLAENIPIIGGVFKIMNGPTDINEFPKAYLVNPKLSEKAQSPLESDKNEARLVSERSKKGYTIRVDEVYSDGLFVHAGVQVVPDNRWIDKKRLYLFYDIVIDGEKVVSNPDLEWWADTEEILPLGERARRIWDSEFLLKDGNRYIGTNSFLLPERYQGREELKIELHIYGIGENGGDTGDYTECSVNFTVKTDTEAVIRKVEKEFTSEGITFVSAKEAETGLEIRVDGNIYTPGAELKYKDERHPAILICNDSEEDINANGIGAEIRVINEGTLEQVEQKLICYNSLDKKIDEWIMVIRDKNREDFPVITEFTFNFADGSVKVSENYKNPKSKAYYDPNEEYTTQGYFLEEGVMPSTDYFVKSIYVSEERHKSTFVGIGSKKSYKEIVMEVYKDDEMLISVKSVNGNKNDNEGWISYERVPKRYSENGEISEYLFALYNSETNVKLNADEEITIKIKDSKSGEYIYEETVELLGE